MLLSRYYHCCAPTKALGVRPPIFRLMLYETYSFNELILNKLFTKAILAFYLLWVTRREAIEF